MQTKSLGDRMKEYEAVSKTRLVKRMPVIIRIDGKAFHTFAKHFTKPFSCVMGYVMAETTKKLCEEIQGTCIGYTQSDEITLVLQSYKKLTTDAWLDNEVQKICSIAASLATYHFNRIWHSLDYKKLHELTEQEIQMFRSTDKNVQDMDTHELESQIASRIMTYTDADNKIKLFDARCFNIPKEEVCNNLIWRQQDATRNSIEAFGRAMFSSKQLHNKNTSQIQDMAMEAYNKNWNMMSTVAKRGCCVINTENGWVIDKEIPIFTQNRDYVENTFIFEEEEN